MPWLRSRYSLRTLLIALAVVPAGVYWIALPTLTAQQYVAALAQRNYAAAERLCVDREHPHPGEERNWIAFAASAQIERLTWSDFFRGRRRMTYFWESHAGSWMMTSNGQQCMATRRGIEFFSEDN
jgi:hypothetical protein